MNEKTVKEYLEYLEARPVVRRPRGNQACFHGLYYKDVICAFDIECSRLPGSDQSFMYSWAFACDQLPVLRGRYWEEFIDFMERAGKATKGAAVPVYVMNLSYEFQFLSGRLPFKTTDVLCGKPREILKAYSFPLEFRCAYKLTGESLKSLTESLNVQHKKLSGDDFDYSIVRYPWTDLTAREIDYIENDVIGLVECIKTLMREYGDTIYSIPITQTGYVRREVKKRMRSYSWGKLAKLKIDQFLYEILRAGFRGGNCHGNRFFMGEVIESVDSWDMSSAYLASILYCKYPVGSWFVENEPDADYLLKLVYLRRRAAIFTARFKDIRLKDKYNACPYIAAAKVNLKGAAAKDNGRILSASDLLGTFTDIDLKIILSQYEYESMEVLELASAEYGMLPEQIRGYVKELYIEKTKLKGVDPIRYNAIKREANGNFGMMAEDPGKRHHYFVDGKYVIDNRSTGELVAEKQENAFLSYAWGVWTTAHVRRMLQEVIDQLAFDDFLYCDTDGIHCRRGNKKVFQEYNKKLAAEAGKYLVKAKDKAGKVHICGAFEFEGTADRFITLGSKKYAEEFDGKIRLTCAGVNKEKGGEELADISNFKEGFTFYAAGGNEAIYNDLEEIITVDIEGHKLDISRNVTLKPCEYTLGLSEEYKRLVLYPAKWLNRIQAV